MRKPLSMKGTVLLFLALVLITLTSPISSTAQVVDWETYHRAALYFYGRGLEATTQEDAIGWYKMAIESYTNAIEWAPSSSSSLELADLYFCRSYVYMHETDWIKSGLEHDEILARLLDDWAKAMSLDTRIFDGRSTCGGCVWKFEGKPDPEGTRLNAAKEWCKLADKYTSAGNREKALMCYNRACELGSVCCDKATTKPTKPTTPTTPSAPSTTDAAKEWFVKGYDASDNSKKTEYYTKAISLDPKYTDAYYNRGIAYDALRKYDQAIADYSKVISLDSKYRNAYYSRGLAYYYLKKYDQAITDYSKAISLDPKYTDAYNNRGLAYYDLKKYDQAIADYSKAISLDPKHTRAYNNRGGAYRGLGKYDLAVADYTKAVSLDTKYTHAYYNRGLAYYYLKKYDQAITDYSKTISLDVKYTNAYFNRGLAYKELNDYRNARMDFKKACDLGYKDGCDEYNKVK